MRGLTFTADRIRLDRVGTSGLFPFRAEPAQRAFYANGDSVDLHGDSFRVEVERRVSPALRSTAVDRRTMPRRRSADALK